MQQPAQVFLPAALPEPIMMYGSVLQQLALPIQQQ
jgi:hypothetical protein